MYNQQAINSEQVNQGLRDYRFCLNAWNAMSKKSREELLEKFNHSKVYASRTYSYLFRNIREDLKKALLPKVVKNA